jgi:hypothetical protein
MQSRQLKAGNQNISGQGRPKNYFLIDLTLDYTLGFTVRA